MTDRELIEKLADALEFHMAFIKNLTYENGEPIFVQTESSKTLIVEARAALAAPVVPDAQAQELQRMRERENENDALRISLSDLLSWMH